MGRCRKSARPLANCSVITSSIITQSISSRRAANCSGHPLAALELVSPTR